MKLSPLVIIIIGACVMVMALMYGWSVLQPNMDEASKLEKNAADLSAEGDKLPQAKKRVEHAVAALNKLDKQWQDLVDIDTPPASFAEGGVDLSENAWQLVIDVRKFRDNIQRAVNAQVKKGGIKVLVGPSIPLAPESATTVLSEFFNYPALRYPVVIFDLGTIQVQGTYAQIMANVRAWAHMPHYLAVADGLRLDGTSPTLHGTYNVSMVGFIRGKKLFPAVPESGGGSISLAGFGGPAGPAGPAGGAGGATGGGPRRPNISAGGGGGAPAPRGGGGGKGKGDD